jgi:hypothetical protein
LGTDNFRIFLETNANSAKDSSLFLQAGAETVFYVQASDVYLEEAFMQVFRNLSPDQPVIVESAALRKFIQPALYLFIEGDSKIIKQASKEMKDLANMVCYSDGESFSLQPESVIFYETWETENT